MHCEKSDTGGKAITVTGVGDENNTDICVKIEIYFYTEVQNDINEADFTYITRWGEETDICE